MVALKVWYYEADGLATIIRDLLAIVGVLATIYYGRLALQPLRSKTKVKLPALRPIGPTGYAAAIDALKAYLSLERTTNSEVTDDDLRRWRTAALLEAATQISRMSQDKANLFESDGTHLKSKVFAGTFPDWQLIERIATNGQPDLKLRRIQIHPPDSQYVAVKCLQAGDDEPRLMRLKKEDLNVERRLGTTHVLGVPLALGLTDAGVPNRVACLTMDLRMGWLAKVFYSFDWYRDRSKLMKRAVELQAQGRDIFQIHR